jgi:hypothetical protein
MPCEIDAERRLEFDRIEGEWLRSVPIASNSAQTGPTPDGKMRIDAPIVLIQHLRDLGFPLVEIPPAAT